MNRSIKLCSYCVAMHRNRESSVMQNLCYLIYQSLSRPSVPSRFDVRWQMCVCCYCALSPHLLSIQLECFFHARSERACVCVWVSGASGCRRRRMRTLESCVTHIKICAVTRGNTSATNKKRINARTPDPTTTNQPLASFCSCTHYCDYNEIAMLCCIIHHATQWLFRLFLHFSLRAIFCICSSVSRGVR